MNQVLNMAIALYNSLGNIQGFIEQDIVFSFR